MNVFDSEIICYINTFSQHSWIFDNLIVLLSQNKLMEGGVLATIIWLAWFKNDECQSHNREHIILTLLTCIVAIALARLLALSLPFRVRPLSCEGIQFLLPYGMSPTTLINWSSFPSDNAVLFYALSTGILFASRTIGTFALVYTTLFICFPRIYLGVHYPTDIIAGAIIGMTIAILNNVYLIKIKGLQIIANCSYSLPDLFYPLFFILTFQIADTFDSSRVIITAGFNLFKRVFAQHL
jgi:undecaprenyl-diphosphatase